jgi:hypothetical protein
MIARVNVFGVSDKIFFQALSMAANQAYYDCMHISRSTPWIGRVFDEGERCKGILKAGAAASPFPMFGEN